MEKHLGFKYTEIVADAGYESEENYLFIEENGQIAYIKLQNYEISKKKKFKQDITFIARLSEDLGEAMIGTNPAEIKIIMEERGNKMNIGVLALQGAFAEHEKNLEEMNVSYTEIRQKCDLEKLDGLILPGGESTVQGRLLRKLNFFNDIQTRINEGIPVLATCAGLILISENIRDETEVYLSTLPVTVKRNAYGRQLGSFKTFGKVGDIDNFPMVFIRAPYISGLSGDVKIIAEVDSRIVGVKYKNQLGLAFHPEMTKDYRIHKYFVKLCDDWSAGLS